MRPNNKKLLRIYREEGLRVRRRGGPNGSWAREAPMALPEGPNQRRSLDFVSDSLNGLISVSIKSAAGYL